MKIKSYGMLCISWFHIIDAFLLWLLLSRSLFFLFMDVCKTGSTWEEEEEWILQYDLFKLSFFRFHIPQDASQVGIRSRSYLARTVCINNTRFVIVIILNARESQLKLIKTWMIWNSVQSKRHRSDALNYD